MNIPHSAHTCTRGPCVCKCFRMAELSRNILLQPLCGQANLMRKIQIDEYSEKTIN